MRLELAGSIQLGVLGARGYGRTTLTQGQSAYVVLSWGDAKVPASQEEASAALDTTVDFWRDWLATAKIPDHPWKPYLDRSALTLKALSYKPTGAIMAAATTSLPETPGGARNWDYRFTWIRDSSFMLRALYRLGFDWEAIEYFGFVLDAVSGGDLNRKLELQIMYGIGGERDLTERRPWTTCPGTGGAPGPGRQRRLEPEAARRVGDDPGRPGRPVPPRGRGPDRGAGVGGARRVRRRRPGALA